MGGAAPMARGGEHDATLYHDRQSKGRSSQDDYGGNACPRPGQVADKIRQNPATCLEKLLDVSD